MAGVSSRGSGGNASRGRTQALGGNVNGQVSAASGSASEARADGTRPHLPKLQSNLPRMSKSRVTPAPDLVPARSGQTRK